MARDSKTQRLAAQNRVEYKKLIEEQNLKVDELDTKYISRQMLKYAKLLIDGEMHCLATSLTDTTGKYQVVALADSGKTLKINIKNVIMATSREEVEMTATEKNLHLVSKAHKDIQTHIDMTGPITVDVLYFTE